MPDEIIPISELNAASALTGAELVPIVQDGTTVHATAQHIADLAIPTPVIRIPMLHQWVAIPGSSTLFQFPPGNLSSVAGGGASNPTLTSGGALRDAITRVRYRSGSANNISAYLALADQTLWRYTGGLAPPGHTLLEFIFNWRTIGSDECACAGLGAPANVSTTGEPSAFVSCLMLGKDSADVNLQLMYNDGSGACTKVDTGVAFAAIKNRLLRLLISLDHVTGAASFDLYNLDDSLAVYAGATPASGNVPDATAPLIWFIWMNTGPGTANVEFDFGRLSMSTDFGMEI